MYQVIIPNSVKRDLRRIDKAVAKVVIQQLDKLALNPFLGSPLLGNLSHLMKINIRQQTIEYRIVYKIVEARLEVHVVHIGTRENFYNELRRRL